MRSERASGAVTAPIGTPAFGLAVTVTTRRPSSRSITVGGEAAPDVDHVGERHQSPAAIANLDAQGVVEVAALGGIRLEHDVGQSGTQAHLRGDRPAGRDPRGLRCIVRCDAERHRLAGVDVDLNPRRNAGIADANVGCIAIALQRLREPACRLVRRARLAGNRIADRCAPAHSATGTGNTCIRHDACKSFDALDRRITRCLRIGENDDELCEVRSDDVRAPVESTTADGGHVSDHRYFRAAYRQARSSLDRCGQAEFPADTADRSRPRRDQLGNEENSVAIPPSNAGIKATLLTISAPQSTSRRRFAASGSHRIAYDSATRSLHLRESRETPVPRFDGRSNALAREASTAASANRQTERPTAAAPSELRATA